MYLFQIKVDDWVILRPTQIWKFSGLCLGPVWGLAATPKSPAVLYLALLGPSIIRFIYKASNEDIQFCKTFDTDGDQLLGKHKFCLIWIVLSVLKVLFMERNLFQTTQRYYLLDLKKPQHITFSSFLANMEKTNS